MNRRQFITAALAALSLGAAPVVAQSWPSKPVRIVVPYPPGGANDIVARALQPALAASLGQPIVIENRGGGATQVGTEAVARSLPDGSTFLLTNIALGANPSLFARLPYDTMKDLAPITLISKVPLVLVVHPSVPAHDVNEFVALAKAKPGSINYGTAGNGSANHLAMEMFRASTGIDVVHVPYKGFGPALADLLAGQVSATFASTLASLPHVRAGKLRALGVSTAGRSAAAPDLPTIAESGVPGFDVSEWQMLLAPAGTPQPIIDRMQKEIFKAINVADVRSRLSELGATPVADTPVEAQRFLRGEIERWSDVAKRVGLKPQD